MSIQIGSMLFSLLLTMGGAIFIGLMYFELRGEAGSLSPALPFAALLPVACGWISLFSVIGHPERFLNILGHPASAVAQEYTAGAVALVIVCVYTVHKFKKNRQPVCRAIILSAILLSLIIIFILNRQYMISSRPALSTGLIPLGYALSGVSAGLFLLYAVTRDKMLGYGAVGIATFFAIVLVCYLCYLAKAPFQVDSRSVSRLLTGDLSVYFWLCVVAGGVIVPISSQFVLKGRWFTVIIAFFAVLLSAVFFRVLTIEMGSRIYQIQSFF